MTKKSFNLVVFAGLLFTLAIAGYYVASERSGLMIPQPSKAAEPHFLKARELEKREKYKEANAEFDVAIQLEEGDYYLSLYRLQRANNCLLHLNDDVCALADFRAILKMAESVSGGPLPSNPDLSSRMFTTFCYEKIAELDLKHGRYDEALAYYSKLGNRYGFTYTVLEGLGDTYKAIGNKSKAALNYEQALAALGVAASPVAMTPEPAKFQPASVMMAWAVEEATARIKAKLKEVY